MALMAYPYIKKNLFNYYMMWMSQLLPAIHNSDIIDNIEEHYKQMRKRYKPIENWLFHTTEP